MTKQQATPPRRGPSYPNYGLQGSLKVLGIVSAYGARKSEVPKSVVASELKMGEGSSALFAMIASAKCFGMVEGNRSLSLTEDGERYCFPASENDVKQALLSFFKSPEAFRFLIERYDGGKLPKTAMLANLLTTSGKVPRSWAPRAASLFLNSATEVGALDSSGFLRFEAARHMNGGKTNQTEEVDYAAPITTAIPSTIPKPQTETIIPRNQPRDDEPKPGTTLWRSGSVRVETPDPLTKEIWSRLRKYVDLLEPLIDQGKDGES